MWFLRGFQPKSLDNPNIHMNFKITLNIRRPTAVSQASRAVVSVKEKDIVETRNNEWK